jgi:hypothetical protein
MDGRSFCKCTLMCMVRQSDLPCLAVYAWRSKHVLVKVVCGRNCEMNFGRQLDAYG